MSKEKTEAPAALPGGKPSGGKKGLIIGLVAAVLVAAGGGGAYWKFVMVPAAAEASAEADTKSHDEGKAKKKKKGAEMPEEPGMVPFEPFLVNLADEGSQSYLRVTLSLLVESEEEAKLLEAKTVLLTRIRSSLLEVLATQTAERLSTAEGKTELKLAIKEKIRETLELEIDVYDVLFSDFVVQYLKAHAAEPAAAAAQAAAAGPRLVPGPVFPGLMDVILPMAVRLGSGSITVGDCLALKTHSIVRLAQSVGQDLDLVVNGETVARGEVAIVDDSTSIRLTDISVTSSEEVDV